MEDTFVVKLHYGDGIRRVVFPGKAESLAYSDLVGKARQLYSLSESAPLQLSYFDDEDDEITLAGDSDLKDALLAQKLHPLHVFLEVPTLETSEEEEEGSRLSKLRAGGATGAAEKGPYYEKSPMDEILEKVQMKDGDDGKRAVQQHVVQKGGEEEQEEQEGAEGKKRESGEGQCTCEAASSGWGPASSHWWNKV
eukprot:jgi/Mesen1/7453/ME000389S06802